MNLKKILIIIISILVLVLAFLLYNIWQSMKSDKPITESPIKKIPITSSVINTTQLQKIQQLTTRPIIGLTIADQKLKYFDKLNGHIFEMALDGTREREIISSDIAGLKSVIWEEAGAKAIIQTQEKQYFYDFETNQVVLVDFEEPIFCKNKIFYLCSFGVCQISGEGEKQEIAFQTAMRDLKLVCANQNIYIYQKPSIKAPGIVYQIDPFKKIIGPYYGLIFKSPDNYSIGLEPHNTIADKCAGDYCAVPQNLDKNILMPDDYYKNLIITQDAFWDIKNKKEIIKTSFDAQNLLVFENKLYFTDKATGYLYMIRLDSGLQ
ncbi:MAG: hypothetical protein ABIG90_00510 [bacterium]